MQGGDQWGAHESGCSIGQARCALTASTSKINDNRSGKQAVPLLQALKRSTITDRASAPCIYCKHFKGQWLQIGQARLKFTASTSKVYGYRPILSGHAYDSITFMQMFCCTHNSNSKTTKVLHRPAHTHAHKRMHTQHQNITISLHRTTHPLIHTYTHAHTPAASCTLPPKDWGCRRWPHPSQRSSLWGLSSKSHSRVYWEVHASRMWILSRD